MIKRPPKVSGISRTIRQASILLNRSRRGRVTTPWNSLTAGTTPYLEASGYVASSELLKVKSPPTFQMRSIIPATLDVQAIGIDGKPLAGRVYASRRLYQYEADARLNTNGHAHFRMLPPGQFVIKLEKPDNPFVAMLLRKSDNPFVVCDTQLPTDQELARKTVVPAVIVNSEPDEQFTVTLKAVRGRISPRRH